MEPPTQSDGRDREIGITANSSESEGVMSKCPLSADAVEHCNLKYGPLFIGSSEANEPAEFKPSNNLSIECGDRAVVLQTSSPDREDRPHHIKFMRLGPFLRDMGAMLDRQDVTYWSGQPENFVDGCGNETKLMSRSAVIQNMEVGEFCGGVAAGRQLLELQGDDVVLVNDLSAAIGILAWKDRSRLGGTDEVLLSVGQAPSRVYPGSVTGFATTVTIGLKPSPTAKSIAYRPNYLGVDMDYLQKQRPRTLTERSLWGIVVASHRRAVKKYKATHGVWTSELSLPDNKLFGSEARMHAQHVIPVGLTAPQRMSIPKVFSVLCTAVCSGPRVPTLLLASERCDDVTTVLAVSPRLGRQPSSLLFLGRKLAEVLHSPRVPHLQSPKKLGRQYLWEKAVAMAYDEQVQTVAAVASGGLVTFGTVGGVTGGLAGCSFGLTVGIASAFFTFGLSIPIGAVLGGGAGIVVGTAVGSATGVVGGGAAGFVVHKNREAIQTHATDYADFVRDKAEQSAAFVKKQLVEARTGAVNDNECAEAA